MEKDTWGAPIAKGSDVWPGPGKPVCVHDDDKIAFLSDGDWYGLGNTKWEASELSGKLLREVDAIRLLADHPIYASTPAPLDEAAQAAIALVRTLAISRVGGKGPHLDMTHASPDQLGNWALDAAHNIESGWKYPSSFSGYLGGWEQSLLKRIANELEVLSAVHIEARRIANLPSFPKAVDPDVEEAERIAYEAGDLLSRDLVLLGIKAGRERKA